MTMEDWAKRIDKFINLFESPILQDSGKVSAEYAKEFAESEFEKYRIIQDRLFQSDFDRFEDNSLPPLDMEWLRCHSEVGKIFIEIWQIHLHTILHQNKSDENARGHIGTEINNKAETVIQIEKDKDDSKISKVESVHTRSKDFLPFAFYINDQSLPELLPDYVPTKKSAGRPKQEPFSPGKNIHESTHRKALEMAFEGKETISGYKALEEELTTAYELAGTKLNHNKIVETIKFLTNKRMVVQESRGIYRFIPDYHYWLSTWLYSQSVYSCVSQS